MLINNVSLLGVRGGISQKMTLSDMGGVGESMEK